MAVCRVSTEQVFSANWYHQWPAGHLSLAPTAIGTTSMALSLATASLSSVRVFGVPVMPAFSKRSLLYQMPVMPKVKGRPYCLPSTSHGLATPPNLEMVSAAAVVRSFR